MIHNEQVRAIDEAGHAVAALTPGVLVERLNLENTVSTLTGLCLDAYCDPVYDERQEPQVLFWQRLVVAYAGPLAQADLTNRDPIAVLNEQREDHDYVVECVRFMQQHLGEEESPRFSAWERASETVTSKRRQLQAIANALINERTMTEKRLKDIWST